MMTLLLWAGEQLAINIRPTVTYVLKECRWIHFEITLDRTLMISYEK